MGESSNSCQDNHRDISGIQLELRRKVEWHVEDIGGRRKGCIFIYAKTRLVGPTRKTYPQTIPLVDYLRSLSFTILKVTMNIRSPSIRWICRAELPINVRLLSITLIKVGLRCPTFSLACWLKFNLYSHRIIPWCAVHLNSLTGHRS